MKTPNAFFALACLSLLSSPFWSVAQPLFRFQAQTPDQARAWQQAARSKLFSLLMAGAEPARVPLDVKVLQRIELTGENTVLEELTIQSLPDRRAHVWLARPTRTEGKVGAVLAINGHGGSGEQVIRGEGLYWYGRSLRQMGYVVIAPDVGQHELQHTNWSLMGERTWDALRCVDYLVTLPEVDSTRLGVAGLSLGGETTMYVAALDERLRIACSSGWLTTVANMKNGHCPCYNFPGLEDNFDFSDIFSCVAPRPLFCELGEQESAPGGFPVEIGRSALAEIKRAYAAFNASSNLTLTVHPGPHVFAGHDFFPKLSAMFGRPSRVLPDVAAAVAWCRFSDGPETLNDVPYYWLGRERFAVDFQVAPKPGDALEINWGSKGDVRDATLVVNGKRMPVQAGGHWGFRWVRVPLDPDPKSRNYQIEFEPGRGRPAFLSEVRLARAEQDRRTRDLSLASYKAAFRLLPPDSSADAFPEMRRLWQEPMRLPAAIGHREEYRTLFREAEVNARLANEALFRSRRYIDGWLAHADPSTGLIPRNLNESRDFWNGRDSAADNYPFMVLTASMTDKPLLQGRMLEMLRTETRLTSRLDRLPDDYSFSRQGWRRAQPILGEMIFDGAEYVKDGLLPITEWLGQSPWADRMLGITDDIWKHAEIETAFGKIPTLNFEVCGDLLQACSRLYWFTGDRKYLDWAIRLGDYFLLGNNHPTRDLKQLRLVDHGCEVVNGLTELYVAVNHARPEKKEAYQKPLHEIFDCILAKGRNEDGLLYTWFNPATGEHSKDLCDTWGYDYDGFYTVWLIDGITVYRDAVRKALGNLKGKYVGACWAEKSADAYADSIEGAINLFNREPVLSAADWIDSQIRMMWAIQKPDGIIEAWHGDGNFARTSLMYALWKTQGITLEPWRSDLRYGAVQQNSSLYLAISADKPWDGVIRFDQPRHRTHMRLPLDYTRINQFPEWFTVRQDLRYELQLAGAGKQSRTGEELARGLPLKLKRGQTGWVELHSR